MLLPVIVNAQDYTERPKTITLLDENVPTWGIGDSWTYTLDVEGGVLDILEFNFAFTNFEMSVASDSGSDYDMDVSGDVSGEISINKLSIIKGTLTDTTISGDATYQKSNTGIKSLDVTISGDIRLVLPTKPFSIDLRMTFSPSFNPIEWPLSVGKQWNMPTSNIEGKIDLIYDGELIFDDLDIPNVIGGQPTKCMGMETISVGAGTFDAYKVKAQYEDIEFYYASTAGNIIDAHAVSDDYTLDVDLISYSYSGGSSGAPNKPSKPSGSSSGTPGTTYTYSSSTADNEGDQVSYLFDWGDGTDSGWIGPKNSGETASASHSWGSTGTYQVKVKAKDTGGHVSVWSDPLSVTMPRKGLFNRENLIHLLEVLKEQFPKLSWILERPLFQGIIEI